MVGLRTWQFVMVLMLAVGCLSGSSWAKPRRKHHARHTRHVLKSGSSITRRSNGRVADVHDHRRGMDIHHGVNGGRRVSVARGDSRFVAERGRPGFVERRYSYRGHDYYRRSYYYHGRFYEHYYRGYYYRGVGLHVYAPYHYYSVGFYGWAYHPWRTRVVYEWGWGGSPWYGYYGGYYAPYAYYPGAPAWLTDYMISNDLQAAYQAGLDAGNLPPQPYAAGAAPVLSPEVKDQVATEVQAQIELENAEAALVAANKEVDPGSSGVARLLADGKPHVFVVGSPLDVEDEVTGEDCALTEGDVLGLSPEPPDDEEKTASLVVLASKGGVECAKSATVTVDLDDLQEMQNHMREAIDRGLEELQQKQGTGGLPAVPAGAIAKDAAAPPAKPAFAELAPPPDPNDAVQIQKQEKEADAAEKDVTNQEKNEGGPPKPVLPPTTM